MIELFSGQALCAVSPSANGAGVKPTFVFTPIGINATGGAHTSLGVYDVALDQELADTDGVILATARGTSNDASIAVSRPDASTVRVTTGSAAAAVDTIGFNLVAFRRPAA